MIKMLMETMRNNAKIAYVKMGIRQFIQDELLGFEV